MITEKLVRNKIPEFSATAQDGRRFRVASTEEMPRLLVQKLHEEASEAEAEISAPVVNRDKLAEEIADIMEVLLAITIHHGIDPTYVTDILLEKAERKGGFSAGIVLDLSTDIPKVGR